MPAVVDHSTRQILVDAPPELCYEVICDFESYPEWVRDLKRVEVSERDKGGRARHITFHAMAMGRSTTYVLEYDYESEPLRIVWKLLEGDLVKQLDGEYRFVPAPDEEGKTLLTYSLTVDLVVPVPGYVRRRAEARILQAALEGFRRRVESKQREESNCSHTASSAD